MNRLTNKRILLGVTGGIAAYKSADLVRRLQDDGADVRVIMTPSAQEFITPLTMQALFKPSCSSGFTGYRDRISYGAILSWLAGQTLCWLRRALPTLSLDWLPGTAMTC